MRIVIAGSRDFNNYQLLTEETDKIIEDLQARAEELNIKPAVQIVSGTARGADRLGEIYAKDKGYNLKQYPADWNTYGNSAGYIRNEQMAKYGNVLIAFWDGKSRGTQHMINLGHKHNMLIYIIKY